MCYKVNRKVKNGYLALSVLLNTVEIPVNGYIYPYQSTADVGLVQVRKEVVASQQNSWRIEIKCSERKNC